MLGRGAVLRDTPSVSLTRPLPDVLFLGGGDRSWRSQSPDSHGWFANTYALRQRMSRQSRLPSGVLGDAPHQGLLRGHAAKTKGQPGRHSQQQGYPRVTTPAEQIQEAKSRTRAE